MNWQSIEQIVAYFKLDASPEDAQHVRRALKSKISKLHPDNNDSIDQTEDQKKSWEELMSAKEYMEKNGDNQLISISQLPALLKAINSNSVVPIETRISDIKKDFREVAHRRNTMPRIGSGIFAAITGFLFSFSGAMNDHPLLGEWLAYRESQMILLGLMFYSGVFFIYTWVREKKQEETVAWLTSNEGIKEIFRRTLRTKYHGNQRDNLRISASDIISEIDEESRPLRAISEKVALIQIDSLIERGVLIEMPIKGFEKEFELTPQALDELLDRYA